MIRSGELRERIEIHGTQRTVDPRWGATTTATMPALAWAKVVAIRAEERLQSGQVQSDITHVVTIRYRDDITEQNTLVWRGRTLEITGVIDPDGRRAELEITCREQPVEVSNG